MANQLVMYEEELTLINTICAALQRDSNSKAVFVIDKNGQEISHSGDVEELDVTSLSSLTAGNVAAMGGLAKLIGEFAPDAKLGIGLPTVETNHANAADLAAVAALA